MTEQKPTRANPIRTLVLDDRTTQDSRFSLIAQVEPDGRLVLAGNDTGAVPRSIVGASEYEYWLTVAADYVPAVLLYLLQERFTTDGEFRAWLDAKGIPSELQTWFSPDD